MALNKIADPSIVHASSLKVYVEKFIRLQKELGKNLNQHIIPRVNIPGFEAEMEVETALDEGLSRLYTQQSILEEKRKRQIKIQENQENLYTKSLAPMDSQTLHQQSDYLHYVRWVKAIVEKGGTMANDNEQLLSTMKKGLLPEVAKSMAACNTVSAMMNNLHSMYHHGYMNSVFFERIQPLPTPVYNKPDAILASVTTVLDFIRLWREFKYFHLLTDVQISTLEAKTLPVAEKERYFQDMQILLGYPDSLEEEIQRMENGGGPGNTSLLGGGLAGARGLNQSVLRPSEDTTENLKNILFGEKRTLELTPYQRAVFYTFKIESYRDRLGRDIAAKKAWANSVVQPAEKKGATAMNVVVIDDNESCEEYGVVQQNTANLPRNKRPAPPQLPCPLRSDGCKALHKQGSVFFCPIFREMSFVQKEDSIKRNNLCPTCLRAAHGTGTECSMVDVRCNYCKADRPGHNKIVCPVH